MRSLTKADLSEIVALLAEGVDRNMVVTLSAAVLPSGRPPRGGRG